MVLSRVELATAALKAMPGRNVRVVTTRKLVLARVPFGAEERSDNLAPATKKIPSSKDGGIFLY